MTTNGNNFQWLEDTRKEASKHCDPYQYLLDRLYYAEARNEEYKKSLLEHGVTAKKTPAMMERETAERFVSLLSELVNEKNTEKLCDKIADGLRSVFGYDRVGLMLYDENTGKIECVRSLGLPESYIENLHIDPAETDGEKMRNHVARCFSERKSFFITDRFKEKEFNIRMTGNHKVYSTQYAVVPVYGKLKTYGVVTVAVQPDNGYFMSDREIIILEFIAHQIGSALENSILNMKVEKFYKDLSSTFSTIIEERDKCTAGHCGRLIRFAGLVGRKLGLRDAELRELELAASLHDIGKIAISDHLLNKPGKLTRDEYEKIKVHAAKGAEMMMLFEDNKNVIDAVKYHHERWDGQGYPEMKKGKNIPFFARVLNVIDAFDVMINNRPYKKAKTISSARRELKKYSGTQFDPELCKLVLDLTDEEIEDIQRSG